MKISIIIPVYYNELNLIPLYEDLREKFLSKIDYDYEIVMVNDGSKDQSYEIMKELSQKDNNIKIISLSRNFGAHSAGLCGLKYATGDFVVIKAADLQEPTELIFEMVQKWREGNNVVLAVRNKRLDKKENSLFPNMYYGLVRKTALPNMPAKGFDVYLIDKKVRDVLVLMDECNSPLTGQILWSGFKTDYVYYDRLERKEGTSKWTLKKKIRLVGDTIFGFSTFPIKFLEVLGASIFAVSVVWGLCAVVASIIGNITIGGWTALLILVLLSLGLNMFAFGIIGEYVWRNFEASRRRPNYIVENSNLEKDKNRNDI